MEKYVCSSLNKQADFSFEEVEKFEMVDFSIKNKPYNWQTEKGTLTYLKSENKIVFKIF